MKKNNPNLGSNFDAFLDEEGIREEVDVMAARKVIAISLCEKMARQNITKSEFARRMGTSRAVVDRILDPNNPSLTFKNAARASKALHMKIKVEMVDA